MSKMLENLKMVATGDRKARLPYGVVSMDEKFGESDIDFDGGEVIKYKLSVEFGVDSYCKPKNVSRMRANMFESMKFAIYGDVQDKILILERALMAEGVEMNSGAIADALEEIKSEVL